MGLISLLFAARQRPVATRRYVGCLATASGLLALVLALALSLGILARLNDNQLRYASPAQVQEEHPQAVIAGLETHTAAGAADRFPPAPDDLSDLDLIDLDLNAIVAELELGATRYAEPEFPGGWDLSPAGESDTLGS